MNQLALEKIEFFDNTLSDEMSSAIFITEFIIDGIALIDQLGDIRYLGNCDNDFDSLGTCIYLSIIRQYCNQLLGNLQSVNCFNTKRVVLYRCHCGCDDCGVYSTQIIVNDTTVEWQQLGWEDHDNQLEFAPNLTFIFDKKQYSNVIDQYTKLCEKGANV